MGLDVSACLVVGALSNEILLRKTIISDIEKKDKKGNKYIVEEKQEVFIFLGKTYPEEFSYEDLLEENDLCEINEEIIGFKIIETESHRHSEDPVEIQKEQLDYKIDKAIKKMKSWGIKAKIYLIQDFSY